MIGSVVPIACDLRYWKQKPLMGSVVIPYIPPSMVLRKEPSNRYIIIKLPDTKLFSMTPKLKRIKIN